MTLILNLETSTDNCSVSLSLRGKIINCIEKINYKYKHSDILHVFIKNILKKSKISISKIKAVCVGSGPGSYTGLRIGITTAKTICYALKIPLLSINSLFILSEKTLKYQNNKNINTIIPMINIKRKLNYILEIDNKTRKMKSSFKIKNIDNNFFKNIKNKKKILIIGNNIENKISNKSCMVINKLYPSSNYMNRISLYKFNKNKIENIYSFEPNYL